VTLHVFCILPSGLSLHVQTKVPSTLLSPCARYMLLPTQPTWYDNPNNIRWRVKSSLCTSPLVLILPMPHIQILFELNQLSTTPWGRVGKWKYSSTTLNLGTRCRWMVSFTLRPLYCRGRSPRYVFCRNLRGHQSRLDAVGNRNISWPCQESNTNTSAISP
jgi:hypothetical protein